MPEVDKKLFTLEAVFAKHGDALLLHYGAWDEPKWILIDGGPPSAYRLFLRPHLDFVRWLYDYADDEPLPLELLMVSHIDDDHVAGVLDLLKDQEEARLEQRPALFEINQLWHNSFDEILDNKRSGHTAALLARFAATADPELPDDLPLADHLDRETRAVIAGTAQGRELRDAAKRLDIPVNKGMRGLVRRLKTGVKSIDMGQGLMFHVLGPDQARIEKFQQKWDKDLAKLQKEEAEAQALVDDSPFNLASICVLAEMEEQRMLLTGDARGDFILEGLEALQGTMPSPQDPFHVQILKMPHHGSDNNVDDNFFESVTADHYVISGDGGFGNPEVATLEMIAQARGNAKYEIDLTFPRDPERRQTTPLRKEALLLIDEWVKESKPATCTVRYAEDRDDWNAIEVDLLDPLYPDGVGVPDASPDPRVAGAAGQGGGNGGGAAAAGRRDDRVERRDFLEDLIYSTELRRERFTQQSPIMPDVWIHYGLYPRRPHDLLLTPDWESGAGVLAQQLRERCAPVALPRGWKKLPPPPKGEAWPGRDVAHNQSTVVARLWFHELLSAALPLCAWWREALCIDGYGEPDDWLQDSQKRRRLADILDGKRSDEGPEIPADLLWFLRLAGVIAYLFLHENRNKRFSVQELEAVRANGRELLKALADCFPGMERTDFSREVSLFSINRNRESRISVHDSVGVVKGDAAQRLFRVDGERIRWAVVDSGIDAEHMAFRRRDASGRPLPKPFASTGSGRRKVARPKNQTRIRATFDFTRIREILSLEHGTLEKMPRKRLLELVRDPDPDSDRPLSDRLGEALRIGSKRMDSKRMIDWEALEPFLAIEHAAGPYFPPENYHGTHVAGILGADWQDAAGRHPNLTGMCPMIELYDFRVLGDDGTGDEFSIMAALQFIRHFNTRFDHMAIHGVNLSFSIEHDVSNYACGQTPVCVEAERLVDNGVVVVTAAGNSGRARYLTTQRGGGWQTDEGFRTVSITDPGNAQSVITVGATHRREPHTYGVSYFSSRGPTGDGRNKPDLVAPGEKISSTVPGNGEKVLDGTSMAAPHVSGAAALLMSRHSELIGDPQRIKRLLCDSATDLGRERYFQGAGLVDILRALQSV